MNTHTQYTHPLGAFVGVGLGAYLSMHIMHWGFGLVLGMVTGALMGDIVAIAKGFGRAAIFLARFPHWGRWWAAYLSSSLAFAVNLFLWFSLVVGLDSVGNPAASIQHLRWWHERFIGGFSADAMTGGAYIALFFGLLVSLIITLMSVCEPRWGDKRGTGQILSDIRNTAIKGGVIATPVALPFFVLLWAFRSRSVMWRYVTAQIYFTAGFFAEVNGHVVSSAAFGSLIGGLFGLLVGDWRIGAVTGAVLCECFYFVHEPVGQWAEAKIEAMGIRHEDRDGVYYKYN